MTMQITQHDLIGALTAVVDGEVLGAAEAGYDEARTPFFSHRIGAPAAVVRPRHAGDVAAAVGVATSSGTPVIVRGGGHSVHSTGDGLLLDMRELRDIDVGPLGRTAWAGAGLTSADLSATLDADGLAVGLGDATTVGIGGLTLGGGIGYLSRRDGLTIDNLLTVELVTADGEIRIVDAEHHPDLFWALRGGGGNVGVATRFRYRLSDVTSAFGGLLVVPATPRVIADLAAACHEADRRMTVIANVLTAPPDPVLPPGLHGQTIVMAWVCVTRGIDPEAAVRPLRAVATPLLDRLGPTRYSTLLQDAPDQGMSPALGSTFLDGVGEAEAAVILDRIAGARSWLALVQVRVLGGAVADVEPAATAFAHRQTPVMVTAVHGEHPDLAWATGWVDGLTAELGGGGAYVGFVGPGGVGRPEKAYPPATLARLRAIKEAHDPDNVFRHNVNVAP
jgi:FAD/FMN-containing dehydrogenase